MTYDLLFSRRIKELSYNPETGVLSITFRTGVTQDYSQVSDRVFQKLQSSSDQNKYYDENIYGNYPIAVSRSILTSPAGCSGLCDR